MVYKLCEDAIKKESKMEKQMKTEMCYSGS